MPRTFPIRASIAIYESPNGPADANYPAGFTSGQRRAFLLIGSNGPCSSRGRSSREKMRAIMIYLCAAAESRRTAILREIEGRAFLFGQIDSHICRRSTWSHPEGLSILSLESELAEWASGREYFTRLHTQ
jgi:hypothetical protein